MLRRLWRRKQYATRQMLLHIDEIHTAQQLLKDEIARKTPLNELIFIIPSCNAFLHRSSRTKNCNSLSSMPKLALS